MNVASGIRFVLAGRSVLCLAAAFVLLAGAFPGPTRAATVTYTLDLRTPGEFKLFAEASLHDNLGIFFYAVPLLGTVTSLDHQTPYTINQANLLPAGFSHLRSADAPAGATNPQVLGSQYILGPPENSILGFGQTAGTWPPGITPAFYPDPTSQVSWSVPLLLATGTYTGTLAFDKASLDLVANVIPLVGRGFPKATVVTHVIPEPGTPAFVVSALLVGLVLCRRAAHHRITAAITRNGARSAIGRVGGHSAVVVAAIVAAHLGLVAANAATVTFFVDTSVPGQFDLYADVSDGDNAGLVSYSVPLLGTFISLDHRAPLTINQANFYPTGFSSARTADAPGGAVNPTVRAWQNFPSVPPQNWVYGFGQEANSWVNKGIDPIFNPDPTADTSWGGKSFAPYLLYDNPVRLATGTYTGSLPTINYYDRNLYAEVLSEVGSRDTASADVQVDHIGTCVVLTCLVLDDLDIGAWQVGSVVTAGPLPHIHNGYEPLLEWHLDSFSGGAGASVDLTSGVFTWDSTGAVPGQYSAIIRGSNSFEGYFETGELTFTLFIPEPATATLLGLALGLVGRRRRR